MKLFSSYITLNNFHFQGGKQYAAVQMLGISHSGIRLIKRERDANKDNLVSIEFFRYIYI